MRKGKEEERETERETEREGREGGREGEKREERREKRAKRSNTRKERRETREVRRERERAAQPSTPLLLPPPHVLHPALAHPGLSSFCSHSSSCSPFSSAPLVSSSSHESFHELLLLLLLPLFHFLSCDLFFFRALCPLCPLLYSGHWTLHNSYY